MSTVTIQEAQANLIATMDVVDNVTLKMTLKSKNAVFFKTAKDAEKAEKDGKDAKEPAKDKTYWSGRLKKLQDQVEKDEASFLVVQTTINTLTVDFVNRPDSGQRLIIESDRQKALAEFSKLKQSITNGKQSIIDLEEEARRAGVPAGWVR
jgi:hypothetical protein